MAATPPSLFVAFKRGGQNTLERAASWFGQYVHCEIVLRYWHYRPAHYVSFTSYIHAGVRSQSPWTHDPDMWTLVDMKGLVDDSRVGDVIAFCEYAVSHRVDYDTVGAVCSVAPMPVKWFISLFVDDDESYFCSEFTLRALMKGGFDTDVNPQLVSPTGLWELLTRASKRVHEGTATHAGIAMRRLVL